MTRTSPKAEAATINKTLAQQASTGLVNQDTAGQLWAQYEKIADQRYIDYGKSISHPPAPQPPAKTAADLYKENLFLQVERGDMKFGKAVSMWEAYQEKEEQKQQRRAEVLATPVTKPGLGKETDYKPVNNEQTTIYRNLKDMADRGLISPKLAEAAWANYAETEHTQSLHQETMTVKENLAVQINRGWIGQQQAERTWKHFEQQQDRKLVQGPPVFGRR